MRWGQAFNQRQRFIGLVVLGHDADQAAQSVGIVGLTLRDAAVGGFRLVQFAKLGQRVAQRNLRGRRVGIKLDGLLQQLFGGVQIALGAAGLGLFNQTPIARAVQRGAPAAGRAALGRLLQIVLGFGKALLPEADDAHPAQGVAIVRAGLQCRLEQIFGLLQIAFIERGEAFGDLLTDRVSGFFARRGLRVLGRLFALLLLTLDLREFVADVGVVREALQIGLVKRRVGGARA